MDFKDLHCMLPAVFVKQIWSHVLFSNRCWLAPMIKSYSTAVALNTSCASGSTSWDKKAGRSKLEIGDTALVGVKYVHCVVIFPDRSLYEKHATPCSKVPGIPCDSQSSIPMLQHAIPAKEKEIETKRDATAVHVRASKKNPCCMLSLHAQGRKCQM